MLPLRSLGVRLSYVRWHPSSHHKTAGFASINGVFFVLNRDSSAPRHPYETGPMDRQPPPVSAARARARAMLDELGDFSPEKAPTMPPLIQLESDIDDLFKPIEMPTLKYVMRDLNLYFHRRLHA